VCDEKELNLKGSGEVKSEKALPHILSSLSTLFYSWLNMDSFLKQ